MTNNTIDEKLPEKYINAAKRTSLTEGTMGDWFVGYGSERGCQFEGTWWHMMMFATAVLSSENTKMVVEECDDVPNELYQPNLRPIYNEHKGYDETPYDYKGDTYE